MPLLRGVTRPINRDRYHRSRSSIRPDPAAEGRRVSTARGPDAEIRGISHSRAGSRWRG